MKNKIKYGNAYYAYSYSEAIGYWYRTFCYVNYLLKTTMLIEIQQ